MFLLFLMEDIGSYNSNFKWKILQLPLKLGMHQAASLKPVSLCFQLDCLKLEKKYKNLILFQVFYFVFLVSPEKSNFIFGF